MLRRSGLLAIFVLAAAAPAGAVTDEEVFRTFRFNFVTPGGRAGAMGGAFVGIADDSTAAAANPAGLTNLLSPELFVELRLDDSASTNLSAFVDDPRDKTGVVVTESSGVPENVLYPSFLSWVKPYKHFVLGVSRHELLHTDVSAVNLFTDPAAPNSPIVQANGEMETLVEQFNVGLAKSFGDWFSAGATLSWARMEVEARTDNLFDFGDGLENDFATEVDDDDDALAWSVGLLFKPLDKLHVGAVYRDGPEFDLEERIIDTSDASVSFESAATLADFLGNRNFLADDPLSFRNHFEVPDQYGIGLGIFPTQSLTIAVDAIHVEYSDLGIDFVGNVNALTFPGDISCVGGDCEFTTPVAFYDFDDETIFRLGLEYIWTLNEKTPFAVRAGLYNDPNVRLRSDFGPAGVFIADDATFPEGEEDLHYTLGFGFVLQDKFQADFAADLSELANTYTASIIYHF